MNRSFRYLTLFCCTILLILFLGQIEGYTPAQVSSRTSIRVTAAAFSPKGDTLASGTEKGEIALMDVKSGKLIRTLKTETDAAIAGLAYTADGKMASVSRDTKVRRWNMTSGKQEAILQASENPPRAIATSPDGKLLASSGEDPKVAVWDLTTNKLIAFFEGHERFVNSVAFNSDSTLLASADEQGRIYIWDLKEKKLLRVLLGHSDGVTAIAFNPNPKNVNQLASVSKDTTARLWDVTTGKQERVLSQATKALSTVAFNRGGTLLIAGGNDNNIYKWNLNSGALISTLKSAVNSPIKAIAVSPDGLNFASASENGELNLRDSESNLVKQTIQLTPSLLDSTIDLLPLKLKENKSLKPSSSVKKTTVSPSKKTLIAAVPPPPGGPILVITKAANPFSKYYPEILRNEGLNTFNESDISSVTATTLANYDVVILGEMTLTSAQVTMFTNWVTGGGNLIAMRPDPQLANLLGLTSAASTLPNAYLLVDTSTEAGNGIVDQTIQYHGTADRYTLNGAANIATLYTNPTTATTNPAVTLRSVGNNGGQAAAFTYDLARSIIYTRQGNPAWATQERDNYSPIRSNDLFFGNKSGDFQPDWINLNKVAIPQADEQQRLLVNLIIKMNLDKKPLPHFWYFPKVKDAIVKAIVLMTGDDHANGGTEGRFNQFKALSEPGCSVNDWECIRGTSYIYPNTTSLTNAEAAAFNADGFEVSLHVNTNCGNFTSTTLDTFYTQQLSIFASNYSSIPAPVTERHHCLVWSDWFTTPQVELSKGIRLDTTYYYWPPDWILNRPGFFSGSGMPMRLANQDGTMIDVYHSVTQMTDESGQTYPSTVDALLDRAVGSEGYYGVFNVNAHTDFHDDNPSSNDPLLEGSRVSNAVVTSAKARNIPIISAKQLLTWLDGRNNSSFGSLAWNNNTLNFTLSKGTGANNLQAMLPNRSGNLVLSSITRNSSNVTFTKQVIKGIEYAFFSGDSGSYIAIYTPDTTPPTVTANTPASGATNVNTVTSLTATFSEPIDPATINSSTFELRNAGSTLISATVTYDEASLTATLTPSSPLASSTTYNATVKGGATDPRVKDLAGNALAANFTWSFTTTSTAPPKSIWNSSATPTNPSTPDPNAVELGVKFQSDIDGLITGIRFYKGSGNTGTHIGNLWNSTGTQLATATFSNETALGWQQVNFSTPVAITANTTYVASYHAPNGNYASDNGFFASSGVDNPPLRALRDGVSGGNGVYKYGATAFPNNTYQASNYWVDVVFASSTGPDTTPPTVTTKSPNSGVTGVSTGTSVTATFSEAMDSATINTNTFELRNSSNALVSATISYNTTNRTATLTPSSLLANSTTYTATVKGGSTGVKDLAGNALTANLTWSFTTVATGSSSSIWSPATTPTVLADPDTSAVELGVKFRSDVSGFITGIRFYKSTTNTGTHVGTLWSSTGTQLATATFTGETASGWQQVNFSTPVAITANTTYVASYYTNVGRYSVDQGYFASTGVDNPPLHALSNGSSGGNGVYNYSANPAFPNSTFSSSNYWVDVVFSTN
ncbi:DUF4082 domain-containing protein [Nostocaceae cyanobacterium CENA357]|uniref:DUF4082 domain-containing protein n=1 Tax=Atlanticothrix silvestris CENA357 TaxID=1725252 RepID=A0A8J7HNM6_9CYAN|nr:DUF4082 domain-containing protein [Atlanticothrix silvestris]MBH8555795.1 DUF4082 domain-containing protein [Atlanticothrix silvestris CENA357]